MKKFDKTSFIIVILIVVGGYFLLKPAAMSSGNQRLDYALPNQGVCANTDSTTYFIYNCAAVNSECNIHLVTSPSGSYAQVAVCQSSGDANPSKDNIYDRLYQLGPSNKLIAGIGNTGIVFVSYTADTILKCADVCQAYNPSTLQCEPISNCCSATKPCAANFDCLSNRCVQKVGCSYSNPACSSPQTCISNVCQCPTTGEYCDALTQMSKCVGNVIFNCQARAVCAKWVVGTDCSAQQKVCQSGSCVSLGDFLVEADGIYALNKPMEFSVRVNNAFSDVAGQQVTGQVYDSQGAVVGVPQICYLTQDLLTGGYQCKINFPVGLTTGGDYLLEASTTLGGVAKTATVGFHAYTGVGVSINSPSVVYTHEPGMATLKVTDEGGQIIPYCTSGYSGQCYNQWVVTVSVGGTPMQIDLTPQKDGTSLLTYHQPGKVGIGIAGSVLIGATTSGGQINPLEAKRSDVVSKSPDLSIVQSIPSVVKYGSNTFSFEVYTPSNDPAVPRRLADIPPANINVKVSYPDGTSKTVAPARLGAGKYSFTLDMPQAAGENYYFTISAQYSNWPLKVEGPITVRAQGGTVIPLLDYRIFIVVGLGLVLLVILWFRRRRR